MNTPPVSNHPSPASTAKLHVRGMSCGACVRRVDRALRQNAAVREVSVHLEAAEATVEHDGSLTADALAAIVTGAGYPATPVPASGTSS